MERSASPLQANNLIALGEDAWRDLRQKFLRIFAPDRKTRTSGLFNDPVFEGYPKRALSEMVFTLRASGLIEKSGTRSDAAYSLTPQGVAARDIELAEVEQLEPQ